MRSTEVEGCDIDKDSMGHTPLAWAAGNGHEAVIEILLGREGIDPDKPGEAGRTPLLQAARNGHEGVVRMLLERDDVNPNKPDVDGRTPLWWASNTGCEGVVGRRQPQQTSCGRQNTTDARCLRWT